MAIQNVANGSLFIQTGLAHALAGARAGVIALRVPLADAGIPCFGLEFIPQYQVTLINIVGNR